MKLIHISKTDVGLVRPANEDSIGSIINNSGVYSNIYIVCDGMGGHVGGARASQTAIRSIEEYFKNTPDPTPNIALNDAIEFANMQIFGDAESNPEFKGMGTTVTLMVESDGLFYIAHVGDSRIYINTDKKLYRLTKDHSFVQTLVDAGQLTDAEMETHPRKNELTRALGIAMEVDVEVAPQPIRAKSGDKFLLCSDGLCGLINDTMILTTINAYSELDATVDELIELAKKAGGHDNISADLIEVIESDFAKTKFVDKNNVPNTNTGTQEVKIPSGPTKPKMDKKLQILLSLVVLIVLAVGANFLINTDNEEVPEAPPPPQKENALTLDERVLSLSKTENMNDTMFYAFTQNSYSEEFTNAINESGKYKQLSDSKESKDKQNFYLSDKKTILNVIEVRKLFKESDYEMQEGSFVYILIEDLELKETTSTYDMTDDERLVNKVIGVIKTKKRGITKKQKEECTVTFDPKNKKQRTAYDQPYTVTVTVKKGLAIETYKFKETIKADPKLISNAHKTTINDILAQINKRDDVSKIVKKGCTIVFDPSSPPPSSYEEVTDKVVVTVSLEGEEKSKTLYLTIPIDKEKKNANDISIAKDDDYVEIYKWHDLEKEDCLTQDQFIVKEIGTKKLYKYTDQIVISLNNRYLNENKIMESEDFKNYTETTEECENEVWFFSDKKQKPKRRPLNQFTKEELKILTGCTEKKYPIEKCPPSN